MANVINANDILIGTGKLYIDGQDVGQIDGEISFTHAKEFYEKKSGFPASTVVSVLTEESLNSEFNLLEANLDRLRGMMSEYPQISTLGEESDAVEETVPVYSSKHTRLAHNNITTLTSVTDDADPSPNALVEGTDYYLDRLSGLVYKAGSEALDDGDNIIITYKHTPPDLSGFGIGGASTTSADFLVEFVHKRRDNTYRIVRLWKCQISGDFTMSFQEQAESPIAMTITALADSTKSAGHQFGEVVDTDTAPYGGW
jgi:hypothetical protein